MPSAVVFIDFQNTCLGARDRFYPREPAYKGTFDPLKLATLVVSRRLEPTALVAVHVYRGLPDATLEPKGHAAAMRQKVAHEAAGRGLVIYHHRPLRYPAGFPRERPQEKGVDVELAIDFVRLAVQRAYEVGILISCDTDLRPALETVLSLQSPRSMYPRCEVAAWRGDSGFAPRLSISTARLWCHWLSRPDFVSVADGTDYTRP